MACLDLTNSFGALENKEQILQHLAAHAINVHLKDFAVERIEFLMGFAFRGRPVGEGCLPLADLFSTLAKHGNRPNVIVEHWTPFAGTLEKTLERVPALMPEPLPATIPASFPAIHNTSPNAMSSVRSAILWIGSNPSPVCRIGSWRLPLPSALLER